MGHARIRNSSEKVYRGADEFRQSSLTVEPGVVVEVSDAKAHELLASSDWVPANAEASAIAEKIKSEQKPAGASKPAGDDDKPAGDPSKVFTAGTASAQKP